MQTRHSAPTTVVQMERSPRAIKLLMEPAPAKGFFRLPWEIRMRIYELSLVEQPKWEKIHEPDCDQIAQDLHSCERPPFINRATLYTSLPDCQCAKRHSLNILLANRQVHSEAAPVFWSRNTFCFTRASDIADDIGQNLRPAHRLLLRHISLLLYACDSLPNKAPFNFMKPAVDSMWETLLQCNGLTTLEMSFHAFAERFEDVCRIRKQMPDLQSLSMTTLMAYRVWPRKDQSKPARPPPWTMNNGEATNGPPRPPGHNNSNNNNTQSQQLSQPAVFVPFANDIPAPPPPPPAEHYLVLNPRLAGYDYCSHRDLSRTLWFKAGIPVDLDAATVSLEAYIEVQRNFRTNFLVHLRHEISKLPEAWARDYQMGAASLRTPWTRPPAPLPRRDVTQEVSSESSSSGSAGWDPNYGATRHHPMAIRRVCGRLPEHMRDGPYTDNNVVLRDGRQLALQIMGLPISKQMRTWRFQQRMRIAREKHAAGELTAHEAVEAQQAEDRRATHRLRRYLSETRDAAVILINRRQRNRRRETTRRTEEREARAAQRARLDEQREAQDAVRKAARCRLSDENATPIEADIDEGSEADTEEEEAPPKPKTAKPQVRGKTLSPPKKTKKPAVGKASFRNPASSSRQQGRMELYYGMRDGDYDDEGDFDDLSDYDSFDEWSGVVSVA